MKKMIKLLLYACVIFSGLTSGATSNAKDSPTTKIENPTYTCGNESGAFFFDVVNNRVWQGEVGQIEGIEHTVTKAQKLRCPNCFDFYTKATFAHITADNVFNIRQGAIRSNMPNEGITLLVTITVQGEGSGTFNAACELNK